MGERLLFDTNALIDIYKGRERIQPYVQKLINDELDGYLSVISEAELWQGLRVGETERHLALVSQFVSLPLNADAAQQAGLWMGSYRKIGLGWMDALICATGFVMNVPVLTRDKRLISVLKEEERIRFEVYG